MARTRKTRAAARAEQETEPAIHTDADTHTTDDSLNDEDMENTAPADATDETAAVKAQINTLTTKAGTKRTRAPLEEIAANWCEQMTSGSSSQTGEVPIAEDAENVDDGVVVEERKDPKKTRKNKKKRGQAKKAAKTPSDDVDNKNGTTIGPVVVGDDIVIPGSPASDEAVEILKNPQDSDETIDTVQQEQPKRKVSPAVKATRGQLARRTTDEEEAATSHHVSDNALGQTEISPEAVEDTTSPMAGNTAEKRFQELFQPLPIPEIDQIGSNVSLSPPKSPGKASLPLAQDPIEALDAAEEQVEAFEKSLSEVRPIESPTKSIGVEEELVPSDEKPTSRAGKPKAAKAAVSKTKPPARPSTKPVSPSLTTTPKSRPTSMLIPKPDGVTTTKQRSAITALHTPPPLARSSKPVTTSNFRLPGEELAAKIKVQKEERLQRQEAAAAKRASIAAQSKPTIRPAPTKKPPTNGLKTTTASRMRDSIVRPSVSTGVHTVSTNRSSTAGPALSTALRGNVPRVSTLAMRPKPSPSTATVKPASKPPTKPVGPSLLTRTTSTSTSKRNLSISSTTNIGSAGPDASSTKTKPASTATTEKGKTVFNRNRIAQEEREKEARDKAEAAKKAREEAAERGRAASRAWAERMGKKAPVSMSASGPSTAPAEDCEKHASGIVAADTVSAEPAQESTAALTLVQV